MTNLVISSHPQDEDLAARLAVALRRSGFFIGAMPTEADWRQKRAAQLDSAAVVIALWSETSVGTAGEMVQEEAERAKARGVLLGVRIAKVPPPLGFGSAPTFDLFDWRGSPGGRAFKKLVKAARAVAAKKPLPPARPSPWWWAASGSFALGLLGFISDLGGTQGLICQAPGIHQVCGRFQLGGVATLLEQKAWDSIASGDCEALRRHVQLFPNGVYAEEATRRLTALKIDEIVSWEKKQEKLPLTVSSPVKPQPTEALARQVALELAEPEAARLCSYLQQNPSYRLDGSAVINAQPVCRTIPGGFTCRVDAEALCSLQVKKVEQREVCR